MVKANVVFLIALSLGLSSGQVNRVPKRTRTSKYGKQSSSLQSEESYFGRTISKSNNLRRGNNIQRSLELSMPMSMPEFSELELSMSLPVDSVDETTVIGPGAPIGCMVDDDCSAGSYCKCWLNCRLCIAEFAPCGTCKPV